MSVAPDAPWYWAILAAVEAQQAGVTDRLGRPWAQHFERVALRLIFRNPSATRAQIEAALLHDALMARGGGQALLDRLGVGSDARELIRLTTPPPDADYYRAFEEIGSRENAIYLDYVRGLIASGSKAAVEMKLADIQDTIDACRAGATDVLVGQFRDRYEPSRLLLEQALSPRMTPPP
ncbi:hypothetical protein OPKNFCMD_5716 [Methylobacterium crusticola]|uniref:HD domain-containing protein n=1 Tax=Methylobacterium crusticola TaxID=1697972 RepID=A0ABQ4R5J1_9HYPH|nr:hypothetical protein [Methylobacterium crusticola]GJD52948.1 hypothetical protein OPKNFCMD_5716 [Methylobacterium crusticola]